MNLHDTYELYEVMTRIRMVANTGAIIRHEFLLHESKS